MDVLLEPALSTPSPNPNPPGYLAGRPLREWNEAYAKVEAYFHALRVENKLMSSQLVIDVLKRAMMEAPQRPHVSATELAVEETDRLVTAWFAVALEENPACADDLLSTRGRLALLLADMPGKWQDQFLRPPPWPEGFVSAMREAYLRAGPDFQVSRMVPRPFDLGPITTLANLSELPVFKFMALSCWLAFGLGLVAVFLLAH
jgi:hypothetical protein